MCQYIFLFVYITIKIADTQNIEYQLFMKRLGYFTFRTF